VCRITAVEPISKMNWFEYIAMWTEAKITVTSEG
jgi:hypothetical protein